MFGGVWSSANDRYGSCDGRQSVVCHDVGQLRATRAAHSKKLQPATWCHLQVHRRRELPGMVRADNECVE